MSGNPISEESVAAKIDNRIKELDGWRGQLLAKVRQLIHEADPKVVEEWKWVTATKPGVPVWSHDGIVCIGESYKDHLKLNFLKGGLLKDPSGLFPSYEGGSRRSIDLYETDQLDEAAFKKLIGEAVALNTSKKR
jgi:hypothetical protein